MKKVALVQHSFLGGGKARVLVSVIDVLNELGIVPDLYCFHSMPQEKMTRLFAKAPQYNTVRVRGGRALKGMGLLKVLVSNATMRRRLERYDLLFNNEGTFLSLPKAPTVVSYVHFPKTAELVHDLQWQGRLKAWGYTRPMLAAYLSENPEESELIFTNSQYTRETLLTYYPLTKPDRVFVLHPPVDISAYWSNDVCRRPAIVSVGNFESKKAQLQQILLAKQLPSLEFHIVGSTHLDMYYYRLCERTIARERLTNVFLHPNAPRDEVVRLLGISRFFLHARVAEHFGIALVEAIAAGCIPIVHDSGGQREIVPDQNLRFASLEQVPQIIEHIGDDAEALRTCLQSHIKKFDEQVFMQQLQEKLRDML